MQPESIDILPENTQVDYQEQPKPGSQSLPQAQPYQPGNLSSAHLAAQQQSKETGVYPEFEVKLIKNNFKSEQKGRPIYDEVEWITIRVAGDRNSVVERKVTDIDRQRFPAHYEIFKAGEKMAESGTPIEEWTSISRSQAANLKAINIYTVEALAGISDQGIANIGLGGRDLVEQAKAFLEAAKDNAVPQHLAMDNKRLKQDVDMLTRQLHELGERMDDYQALQTQLAEANAKNAQLEGQVSQLQTEAAALKSQQKPPTKKKSARKKA